MPSKLGTHTQHAMDIDAQVEVHRRGQPRVAKIMEDNPAMVRRCKEVSPNTFWNGRVWWPEHKQDVSYPRTAATMVRDRILRQAMCRDVDAWEPFNEPDQWDHLNQSEFECWFSELMHAEGLKTVAFNWSVGNPRLSIWTDSVVLEALRLADYLGIHEYDAPLFRNPPAFSPPVTDWAGYIKTGWFCLRYRKIRAIIEQYLKPEDLPEFLITEFGIDSGAPHVDPGAQGGWKSFYGRDEMDRLFAEIEWFDLQTQMDDYLKGFEWFNFGTRDQMNWGTFDMFQPPEAREYFTRYLEDRTSEEPPADDEWHEYALHLEAKIAKALEILA